MISNHLFSLCRKDRKVVRKKDTKVSENNKTRQLD